MQGNQQRDVANVYSNLARIALDQSQYDKANQFIELSLNIRKELNDVVEADASEISVDLRTFFGAELELL